MSKLLLAVGMSATVTPSGARDVQALRRVAVPLRVVTSRRPGVGLDAVAAIEIGLIVVDGGGVIDQDALAGVAIGEVSTERSARRVDTAPVRDRDHPADRRYI